MSEKNSKIKFSILQKILIFGSLGIVFLGAILILIIYISSIRPQVAFYNVSEKVQDTVVKMLNDQQNLKKEKHFDVIVLDSTIPLSAQEKTLKKADFLIAENNYDVKNYVENHKKTKSMPASLLDNMPSSTVQTVTVKDNSIKYVPILYDFYQIDVNYPAFVESGIQNISLWSDLTNLATTYRDNLPSPLLMMASEDKYFIDVFGMILETLCGYEELQKLEDALYTAFKKDLASNSSNNEILHRTLSELTTGDTAINNTFLAIIKLIYSEILPKNYTSYVNKDFTFFMNENLCTAAFTSLSIHRSMEYSTLKNYKSIYSPNVYPSQERKFQAPQIIAVSLNKNMTDYASLLSDTNQSALCTATGLAPVQKNCSVPDVQADDVRYWLAASSGPIMPLSASVPSKKAQSFLAQYLKDNASF